MFNEQFLTIWMVGGFAFQIFGLCFLVPQKTKVNNIVIMYVIVFFLWLSMFIVEGWEFIVRYPLYAIPMILLLFIMPTGLAFEITAPDGIGK